MKKQLDLPQKSRNKVAEILQQHLSDLIDFQGQLNVAHWNLTGMQFYALHELFEKINGQISEHVDDIAERIVQLGGYALGSAKDTAKVSELPSYPKAITDGADHLKALLNSLSYLTKTMRHSIETTDDLDDEVTSDLVTEVSRSLDKQFWFISSHLD